MEGLLGIALANPGHASAGSTARATRHSNVDGRTIRFSTLSAWTTIQLMSLLAFPLRWRSASVPTVPFALDGKDVGLQ